MGHEVRLIPPAYVKPFVKRGEKDAVAAEAICEAAQRPGMRFVAVKSEEQQSAGLVFRTRDLPVRVDRCRGHYNDEQPHSAIGNIPLNLAAIPTVPPALPTRVRRKTRDPSGPGLGSSASTLGNCQRGGPDTGRSSQSCRTLSCRGHLS